MYTFEQTYLTPQNSMPTIKRAKSFSETIMELNKEFDESIYFNHHYTALRNLYVEKPISSATIPFLMTKEFLFSYKRFYSFYIVFTIYNIFMLYFFN